MEKKTPKPISPCKYKAKCHRPECWFLHDTSDGKSPSFDRAVSKVPVPCIKSDVQPRVKLPTTL